MAHLVRAPQAALPQEPLAPPAPGTQWERACAWACPPRRRCWPAWWRWWWLPAAWQLPWLPLPSVRLRLPRQGWQPPPPRPPPAQPHTRQRPPSPWQPSVHRNHPRPADQLQQQGTPLLAAAAPQLPPLPPQPAAAPRRPPLLPPQAAALPRPAAPPLPPRPPPAPPERPPRQRRRRRAPAAPPQAPPPRPRPPSPLRAPPRRQPGQFPRLQQRRRAGSKLGERQASRARRSMRLLHDGQNKPACVPASSCSASSVAWI